MEKPVRTHFGWRDSAPYTCPHCKTAHHLWEEVFRGHTKKRHFTLFVCNYCGKLDLEVANWWTHRVISRAVTEEEARKLELALKL